MVPALHSQIEIALPPSEVKRLWLDFASYPQFRSALTIRASKPVPEVGDRLEINTGGLVIHPVVTEHTERKFYWQGNFLGLLKGTHKWEFLESREEGNEGGTTFVQAEDVEGVLSFLFARWWPWWLGGLRGGVERDFGIFNERFKGWVERGRERG
ncbi:hypothetical protein N431DRAFT_435535 [Stipitochalara longipes BDJ]|nr:hypothetical protein N431DRAFT_435535 [Stipitochalara longipes BDJ]